MSKTPTHFARHALTYGARSNVILLFPAIQVLDTLVAIPVTKISNSLPRHNLNFSLHQRIIPRLDDLPGVRAETQTHDMIFSSCGWAKHGLT